MFLSWYKLMPSGPMVIQYTYGIVIYSACLSHMSHLVRSTHSTRLTHSIHVITDILCGFRVLDNPRHSYHTYYMVFGIPGIALLWVYTWGGDHLTSMVYQNHILVNMNTSLLDGIYDSRSMMDDWWYRLMLLALIVMKCTYLGCSLVQSLHIMRTAILDTFIV